MTGFPTLPLLNCDLDFSQKDRVIYNQHKGRFQIVQKCLGSPPSPIGKATQEKLKEFVTEKLGLQAQQLLFKKDYSKLSFEQYETLNREIVQLSQVLPAAREMYKTLLFLRAYSKTKIEPGFVTSAMNPTLIPTNYSFLVYHFLEDIVWTRQEVRQFVKRLPFAKPLNQRQINLIATCTTRHLHRNNTLGILQEDLFRNIALLVKGLHHKLTIPEDWLVTAKSITTSFDELSTDQLETLIKITEKFSLGLGPIPLREPKEEKYHSKEKGKATPPSSSTMPQLESIHLKREKATPPSSSTMPQLESIHLDKGTREFGLPFRDKLTIPSIPTSIKQEF